MVQADRTRTREDLKDFKFSDPPHAVSRARQDHILPPSSRLPSPGFDIVGTELFGNQDFTWMEGWNFGATDELFSSLAQPAPFWEREVNRMH